MGVFPEYPEDVGVWHGTFTYIHLAIVPLATFLFGGLSVERGANLSGYASVILALSALSVIYTSVLLSWVRYLGLAFAFPEFLSSAISASWVIWQSLVLLHGDDTRAPGPMLRIRSPSDNRWASPTTSPSDPQDIRGP